MSHRLAVALVPLVLAFGSGSTAVSAMEIEVLTSTDRQLEMPPLTSPWGKELRYTLGIGSGAFRHPADPAGEIWTVGDRGPNMTCAEAQRLLAPETAGPCGAVRNGRYYPTPATCPRSTRWRSIVRPSHSASSRRSR